MEKLINIVYLLEPEYVQGTENSFRTVFPFRTHNLITKNYS